MSQARLSPPTPDDISSDRDPQITWSNQNIGQLDQSGDPHLSAHWNDFPTTAIFHFSFPSNFPVFDRFCASFLSFFVKSNGMFFVYLEMISEIEVDFKIVDSKTIPNLELLTIISTKY